MSLQSRDIYDKKFFDSTRRWSLSLFFIWDRSLGCGEYWNTQKSPNNDFKWDASWHDNWPCGLRVTICITKEFRFKSNHRNAFHCWSRFESFAIEITLVYFYFGFECFYCFDNDSAVINHSLNGTSFIENARRISEQR